MSTARRGPSRIRCPRCRQDVHFLDETVPVLDDEEMEDLYRHFLLDDMPEVGDG